MLREIAKVRQIPGEPRRRWFTDERMDLTVWADGDEAVLRFQLAYDKPHAEKAVTWRRGGGLDHAGVDDGEGRAGHYKATPILVRSAAGGIPDAWRICADVRRRGVQLPPELLELVCRCLTAHQGNL